MSYQWPSADVETPIVELSTETLPPGGGERWIAQFERRMIEPQDAVGARVLGSFRVGDAPDTIVWLRGFTHLGARQAALAAIANGAAQAAFTRESAPSETRRHLLRAISPERGLPPLYRLPRLGESLPAAPYSLVVSTLRYPEWIGSFHLWSRLFLRKSGADPLASFASLAAEDPCAPYAPGVARTVHVALIAGAPVLPPLPGELREQLVAAPEILRLTPTSRSRLR